MFKSLFKKNLPDPEQERALEEANMALRLRMDRIMHDGAAKHFGQAQETGKNRRRIFEGQVAA
jgi:hypothetical protein